MLPALLLSLAGKTAISGDRPGFLNSSTLVPPGMFQVETGLSFTRAGGAPDALATPTALRYGLSEELELRASSTGWNRVDEHGSADESGFGPLTLGVKGPVGPRWADLDFSWADSAAWVAELTLPSGSFELDPHQPTVSGSVVASWTPGGGLWQLGATTGFSFTPGEDSLVLPLAVSASAPLEGQTSVYLQSGWFPGLHVDSNPLYAGAGLIVLPSTDVQFDLGIDFGLGNASGTWIAGLGLCWRW